MKILSGDYYVCIIDACIRVVSIEDSMAIARTPENRKLVLVDHKPVRVIKRHTIGEEKKMVEPLNKVQVRKFPNYSNHFDEEKWNTLPAKQIIR